MLEGALELDLPTASSPGPRLGNSNSCTSTFRLSPIKLTEPVSERLAWAFCLTQMARKSGQRAIDIDDSHRPHVLNVLNAQQIPSHWVRMVEDVLELEADEQSQMFGEALPIGLRLLRTED